MRSFLPTLKCVLVCLVLVFFVLGGNARAQFDCSDPSATGVPETECEALVELYNQTGGASWVTSTFSCELWYTVQTIDDWCGVTVTNDHVTQLLLNRNNLTGTIPTELENLTNLQYLQLTANQLTGTIPIELGNLTNLENLQLTANQLTGTIPIELGNLTNLNTLSPSKNNLTGTIPSQLGNLTSLQYLYLNENELTGTIPTELGNPTNLINLSLNENELTGTIPTELGNLTNLTWLNLWSNELTGTIPTELGNLTNLTRLYLYDNELTGTIPTELGNLTNLIRLYLYDNELTGTIPTELGNLSNLSQLVLHRNQLTGTIPSQLENLTSLQYLYLFGNKLTGTIPDELGNLTNLLWLFLHQNELTGTIPSQLENLTSLQYLYLFGNQLTGTIPTELGNLTNLTQLQRLYLQNNPKLSGGVDLIDAIGTDFGSLLELGLWGNDDLAGAARQASDDLGKRIDRAALREIYNATNGGSWKTRSGWLPRTSFASSTSPSTTWYGVETHDERVISLHLSDNNLEGRLTNALEAMHKLRSIDFSENGLTGSIPDELGNLTNLRNLLLYDNGLTGELPSELGNLTRLAYLYLDDNPLLGGELPLDPMNNTSVSNLDIRNTSICVPGTIEFREWLDGLSLFGDNGNICGEEPATLLEQVTGVNVTPGVQSLSVSWNAAADADGYKVQWKSGAQNFDSTRQHTVTSGSTTTYTIPNLTAGTEYTVRVIAIVSDTESRPSDPATGTPLGEDILPPPPPPPGQPEPPEQQPGDLGPVTGVEVTEGLMRLSVLWDEFPGASGYKVQWESGDQDFDSTHQHTVTSGSTTTYTIPNLTADTQYMVRVIAIVSDTESRPSETATGTPLGEQPRPTPGMEQQRGCGACAIGSDVPGEVSQSALLNMLVVMSALIAASRRRKE